MLAMIDDQARAFFNVVVGATWLFTGKFTQLEIYEWVQFKGSVRVK